jgi:hypothetical protein
MINRSIGRLACGGMLILTGLGCAPDGEAQRAREAAAIATAEAMQAESARIMAASPEMRAVRCEGRLEQVKPYSAKKYLPRCSCNSVIYDKDGNYLQCGQELPLETILGMIRGPYLRNQEAAVPPDAVAEVRRQWGLLTPDRLAAAPNHKIELTPSPQLPFDRGVPAPDRPGTITIK